MSRLRIFHLSGNVYLPLPARHHSLRIWEELARDADEYHVIASAGRLHYSHTQIGKIHLHLLPTLGGRMWSYFLSSWMVVLLGWRHRPTRIVAQCPVHGGLVGALFCRLFSVPLFTEIHGSQYFFPARPGWIGKVESITYRLLSRPAFHASARIRSLSDDMTGWVERTYGRKVAGKVIVIPNRVDLDVFSTPKSSYETADGIRVVSVGFYAPRKNHLRLISDLFAICPTASLTLIGHGALTHSYLELARNLGVSDRLELISVATHRELASHLAQSDLYVHYSLSEGVPRAILEAMAMGLPVVCTPVGFISGILTHNHDVLILGREGAEDLSIAIRRLGESIRERARLGRQARATIEQRFEWNKVFDLYRNAIADCGRPLDVEEAQTRE